jgi:23S rRNA (guanosine2251-2'-O)-methyltransferase
LNELCESEHHQGLVAFLQPVSPPPLSELIELAKQENGVIVALDEVQDPHNLGAVLRVAEATAAVGVILPQDRSAQLTPAARKVSVGASELVPVCQVVNLRRALQDLKKAGVWVIGAAVSDEAQDLFSFEPNLPCVLVLGSEGRGLRQGILEECEQLVRIPMRGVLDSLNVSQSAAVLLYEFLRRRASGE